MESKSSPDKRRSLRHHVICPDRFARKISSQLNKAAAPPPASPAPAGSAESPAAACTSLSCETHRSPPPTSARISGVSSAWSGNSSRGCIPTSIPATNPQQARTRRPPARRRPASHTHGIPTTRPLRPQSSRALLGDSSRMYGPPHDCKGKAVEREDTEFRMTF